ncbi:MAG: alcohol dehydrogenase catalytic domain-containing protein [Planctomycetota bacterium]|jgi:L-iditol 2-dehydrogenase|nr:alcohol dehydrogenase catalytic domain-containing protein [Planctomycetota bacterium]
MDENMRAWVFYEPGRMTLETVPLPDVGVDDLLVKVEAVGICGSDVAYYFGHSPLGTPDGKGPLVLGHEIGGVAAKVGDNAKRLFAVGDRVTLNPVQQCNACPECLDGRFNLCPFVETLGVSVDGGFAEYVKVRYTHALKISPSVSFGDAALTEPLACATYAMRKLDIRLGDYVAVIGSGSIGLMMLQIAKARGAGRLAFIGARDVPLELGMELGADAVLNVRDETSRHYAGDPVEWIKRTGNGKLADRVVVPTSDLPALHWALYGSAPGATIVYFGLPGPDDRIQIPALDAIQADKTIKFSWLSPLVWPEATAAVAAGKVDLSRLVSHRYGFADVEKGIRDMAAGDPKKIKGLVAMG